MAIDPTTLSQADLQRFHDDGYVVVRGAFGRDDALAMQDEWWAELAAVHGILRGDRSTWRPILSDLKRAKTSPLQGAIATPRVRGVIDDLLGRDRWRLPADWGRPLTTFPEPGAWDVATGWHWDTETAWHRRALNGLFVVSFVGAVAPRSGGTLILSGSPRLLRQHEAGLSAEELARDFRSRKAAFHASHPWLQALSRLGPSPPDRIAAFMDAETQMDGVPLRVVELTGKPGDMVFCHPAIIHCVSPNRGAEPRFMRILQQLLTDEGARLAGRTQRPRPRPGG